MPISSDSGLDKGIDLSRPRAIAFILIFILFSEAPPIEFSCSNWGRN